MIPIIDDDIELIEKFRSSKKKEDLELKKFLETNRKKYRHNIYIVKQLKND